MLSTAPSSMAFEFSILGSSIELESFFFSKKIDLAHVHAICRTFEVAMQPKILLGKKNFIFVAGTRNLAESRRVDGFQGQPTIVN